jgi:hypothetical protein
MVKGPTSSPVPWGDRRYGGLFVLPWRRSAVAPRSSPPSRRSQALGAAWPWPAAPSAAPPTVPTPLVRVVSGFGPSNACVLSWGVEAVRTRYMTGPTYRLATHPPGARYLGRERVGREPRRVLVKRISRIRIRTRQCSSACGHTRRQAARRGMSAAVLTADHDRGLACMRSGGEWKL